MPVEIKKIEIRTIEEKDNVHLSKLIRQTLEEFGANLPGTAYYDEATDFLFQLFHGTAKSVYYVAVYNDLIVGGAGIFPSAGLPQDVCEMVKMYLLPQARGIGLGKLLIQKCIDFAKCEGYKNIYLETMPELKQALKIYEKSGFGYISRPMGNTGHFGCNLWMLKKL